MKPFQKNTKQGLIVAGVVSTIFSCLLFGLMLLLASSISGCGAAEYPMMAITDDDPPDSVPVQPSNPSLPTKSNSSQATRIPDPTGIVKTAMPTPAKPVLNEKRLVSVDYPSRLRTGDGDVVKMLIEVDSSGRITPTAEIAGHEVRSKPVEIPNLYDTHQIVAEARLDLAGLEVHPADNFTETMLPGKPVVFYWSIKAPDSGTYRGTLWLYLNLIPKSGGTTTRQTLLAQRIDIEATSFLGLTGESARWMGAGGSALSFVFGIPFLETVISKTWKRVRRPRIIPPLVSEVPRTNPTVPPSHDQNGPPGDLSS